MEDLACKVIAAAATTGAEFMVVGAIAAGAYGVPRSTRDGDFFSSPSTLAAAFMVSSGSWNQMWNSIPRSYSTPSPGAAVTLCGRRRENPVKRAVLKLDGQNAVLGV